MAIDTVVEAAVKRDANASYLSTVPFFTSGGRYRSTAIINNHLQLIREPDGIHINLIGSQYLASEVLQALRRSYGVASTSALPMVVR